MGLGRLLEACQVHEKVALEHSTKSTKYELEGLYDNLIHEHDSFLKLPTCRESALKSPSHRPRGAHGLDHIRRYERKNARLHADTFLHSFPLRLLGPSFGFRRRAQLVQLMTQLGFRTHWTGSILGRQRLGS